MKHTILIIVILSLGLNVNAQEFKIRDSIDKDSLFNVSIKKLPEEIQKEIKEMYKNGKEEEIEILLFMITMPVSSKINLIENYENKKDEILKLKEEYSKLVPEKHIIYIEFEPEGKIFTIPEHITIKIYKLKEKNEKIENDTNVVQRNYNLEVVSINRDLKPGSKELEDIIESIGWTEQTLTKIKELLDNANCISIKNNAITTIGFAISRFGKYSYKIFDRKLTENQIQKYNNGCEYIFYKDNVVLEYGGGAIGQQCFEEE